MWSCHPIPRPCSISGTRRCRRAIRDSTASSSRVSRPPASTAAPAARRITPKRGNVRFFRTAAAAHDAGLRACKRCQPDAVPGSPDWNLHDDLASRAMRLVQDGVVEREGVDGLARRLGYTPRHVSRVLQTELGAGPLALARANRAQTARSLLAATDLPISDIAYAAGFGSLRQFNDTVAAVYRATPSELRAIARRGVAGPTDRFRMLEAGELTPAAPGPRAIRCIRALPLLRRPRRRGDRGGRRLPLSAPSDAARRPGRDRRSPPTWSAPGVLVTARLTALSDVPALVARVRRMFDLDADSVAIDTALSARSRARAARREQSPASASPVTSTARRRCSAPSSASRSRSRRRRRCSAGSSRISARERGSRPPRRSPSAAPRCCAVRRLASPPSCGRRMRSRAASCDSMSRLRPPSCASGCWRCPGSDRGRPTTWPCACSATPTC